MGMKITAHQNVQLQHQETLDFPSNKVQKLVTWGKVLCVCAGSRLKSMNVLGHFSCFRCAGTEDRARQSLVPTYTAIG